ncbi:MAG: AAA family ATPase [Candidatus Omnitrophica bacterium]|nr:AAA family ATPase [Candidatus Omnitrophota bacterium]
MYLNFYGLKENPFNVTSDPSFLYLSNSHREALSHLLYGIKERKGFLEITGEVGAGKTTLCKALLNQLDSHTKTSFILNPNLSEIQLLEAILEDFGLRPERRAKISFLRQLNSFLLDELRENCNVVLILDEAQNLKLPALEAVRLLSNLETDKQKLFQIVLVGQPELRRKLSSPSLVQLRQRIGVRYHLNPLGKDEIDKYIGHRLNVAGSPGDINFTDEALDKIFIYSGGIPRIINIVCDKALLTGLVLETKEISADIIVKSIYEIEGKPVEIRV